MFQVANMPCHNGALTPLISTDIPQVSIFVFMQCLINALSEDLEINMEFISLNVRHEDLH